MKLAPWVSLCLGGSISFPSAERLRIETHGVIYEADSVQLENNDEHLGSEDCAVDKGIPMPLVVEEGSRWKEGASSGNPSVRRANRHYAFPLTASRLITFLSIFPTLVLGIWSTILITSGIPHLEMVPSATNF